MTVKHVPELPPGDTLRYIELTCKPVFDFDHYQGWGPWQQCVYKLRLDWVFEWHIDEPLELKPLPAELFNALPHENQIRELERIANPPIVRNTYAIPVPAGTLTNFASSPFWSWWMGFGPDGDWRIPAAVHDWIYENEGEIVWYKNGVLQTDRWSRENADKLFFRHMRMENVPQWKRRTAYKAVQAYQFVKRRGNGW